MRFTNTASSWLLAASLASACERELVSRSEQIPLMNRQSTTGSSGISLTPDEQIITQSFSNLSMDDWSYYYTHGAHLAGLNKSMAEWTAQKWEDAGIPSGLVEYEVFLNYPKSASLKLTRPDGTEYVVQLKEDVLQVDETTSYPNSPPAFHGYSASGEASAEYVYVGQGSADDFKKLVSLGVELEGKIALAKYGGPFRGLKVKNAEAYGMVACVIFTDPGDDGPQEAKGAVPYPDGPARQASSIQRGSVQFISTYPGDPTTPGRPSKPGVERSDHFAVTPKIPSLPISYRDAIPLLAALDGYGLPAANVSRSGWTGGLNVTYSTGPAPGAVLDISNYMRETIAPVWNVIGIINGTSEDETIIIGNHRDSWNIGGAADPNSGSSMLIELARAFGKLKESGWTPKRNIILCSWDAEEYGLVGSTEWVEEFAPWLSETAITYLNVDIAVSGPFPGISATPELHSFAMDIMKKVAYPEGGSGTFYDAWQQLHRFEPETHGFGVLGSGSDYTAFVQQGIGAIDIGAGGGTNTPVYHYHSNYDSYHWMVNFGDPGFHYHVAIGQYLTLLSYHLANDAILPFDLNNFSKYLGYFYRDVISIVNGKPNSGALQKQLNVSDLAAANKLFQTNAAAFTTLKSQYSSNSTPDEIASVNAKQRDFQRAFVSQGGLPGREFYKNVNYAPGLDTGYAAVTFPGIKEALGNNDFDTAAVWVKKTAAAVRAAADILSVS